MQRGTKKSHQLDKTFTGNFMTGGHKKSKFVSVLCEMVNFIQSTV